MTIDNPNLVSVGDIAREMNISTRTVYRRLAENPQDLPLSVAIDGRKYFVADDIARWRERRVKSAIMDAKRARRAQSKVSAS